MKPIELVSPTTVEQAVQALGDGVSLALAGGMDLIPTLHDNLVAPERVVNLKTLAGFRHVHEGDDELHIGALATLAEIASNEMIRNRYAALAQAAETVGSPQIRNRGTIGGNLCQRPRCWYFRNEDYHCLKKGGDRCFAAAENADNQFHAILGGGPCHIVHPSNTGAALMALDASVVIAGANGATRTSTLEKFFLLPRTRLHGENILQPEEIVTEIVVPKPKRGARSAFAETSDKSAFDWAISGAAAMLVLDGNRVTSARIVLHAVAPIPWRARDAENALIGKPLSDDAISEAAEAALSGAQPLAKNAYKVPQTKTMVRRVLHAIA
jgi:xanthine dehydrogenase YagS FAD-binding subunit